MKNTLEGHKMFPVVAWVTVISFAFFTYTLAANLQDDLNQINQNVELVENSVAQSVTGNE